MRPKWKRWQGDQDDTIIVGVDGVLDLAAVIQVEGHVSYNGGTVETLAATVTDIDAREVTVDLGASGGWLEDAAPGCWTLTLDFTFAGDIGPITWPADGPTGEITVMKAH